MDLSSTDIYTKSRTPVPVQTHPHKAPQDFFEVSQFVPSSGQGDKRFSNLFSSPSQLGPLPDNVSAALHLTGWPKTGLGYSYEAKDSLGHIRGPDLQGKAL